MVRPAVVVALVVAGCSSDAARPERHAISVTRRVVPPAVRTPLHPITQPMVLDDGENLFHLPPLDPLRGGALPDGVAVPGNDAAFPRSELASPRRDADSPTVPVVMSRAAHVERVHAIVDTLPYGRCFDPVVTRDGVAGALIGTCPLQQAERVNLTITVEPDHDIVGMSRVMEFQVIHNVGSRRDDDRLADTLREHKRSAFFADRTDIEVLGIGVEYGELVDAAEVAIRAGFTEVLVVSPRNASARPQL